MRSFRPAWTPRASARAWRTACCTSRCPRPKRRPPRSATSPCNKPAALPTDINLASYLHLHHLRVFRFIIVSQSSQRLSLHHRQSSHLHLCRFFLSFSLALFIFRFFFFPS